MVFQVTSPWKQISEQVEFMKEPETHRKVSEGAILLQGSYLRIKKRERVEVTAAKVPDLFPGVVCSLKTLYRGVSH